jgi:hypothetical protein
MGTDLTHGKLVVMPSSAPAAQKRPRSIVSGILLALAVLLTPLALVTNWAAVQVDNTQRFVDTLGPLASNPKIQELVINEVTNRLDETVDFAGTTSSLIEPSRCASTSQIIEPSSLSTEMTSSMSEGSETSSEATSLQQ